MVLVVATLPFIIAQDSPQKIFLIDLHKSSDASLEVTSLTLSNGFIPTVVLPPQDQYLLELYSFEGRVLYSVSFEFPRLEQSPPPSEWFDGNGNQIYTPPLTNEPRSNDVTLSIPYFPNAKEFVVSGGGHKLIYDVSAYSELCVADGFCEGEENFQNCPSDCPSSGRDNNCNPLSNGICDPDCRTKDLDCKRGGMPYWIIGFLFFIAILWWWHRTHQHKKNTP